jgi:trimeric autotransporter adhesin
MKLIPLVCILGLHTFLGAQTVISTYAGGALPPSPVPAANASVSPIGITFDNTGNLYFSTSTYVFKMTASGTVTRLAGNSLHVDSGDGGLAVNAGLSSPAGLAFDSAGNLFIADGTYIRMISPPGIITTVAGTGVYNTSGDGGPALDARVDGAYGLAFDGSGNLYFSQMFANTVRKISKSGIITTVAGDIVQGFAGDGGLAVNAELNQPMGIAFDSAGNLYIADYANNRVRKVTTAGVITTVVGNGTCCFSGDNGPATGAQLNFPTSVAVDGAGNVYIGDAERVRMVSPSGNFETIAGGGAAPVGSSGPALSVQLSQPAGLALDSKGNLYVTDEFGFFIFAISPAGILSTAVGNGTNRYTGDGGLAVNAQLGEPSAVVVDSAGNLYIGDLDDPVVRKVSPAGIITTIAGNGTPGFSGDGGPATSAQLSGSTFARDLALDGAGNLYIVDGDNFRVRRVSPDGIITTVAGGGTGGDGGLATNAFLGGAQSVAVDGEGNLYISQGFAVRMVSADGLISTVAGNGTQGFSGDGGPATKAEINNATGLAVDAFGDLFIADEQNNRIRMVSKEGIISTVAGGGPGSSPCASGGVAATAGTLYGPWGIALDAAGNLYIAENDCAEVVSPSGVMTAFAGNGTFGYTGDGGPPTAAELSFPQGVAVDKSGKVYIADSYASVIRAVGPAAPTTSIQNVLNAASNLPGPVAPGEIVVITGTGLGPAQLVSAMAGNNGLFGTQLAGTIVMFDGIPAPMVYTSATQVAAIVPYEANSFATQITVTYQGNTSGAFSTSLASSIPALFTANSSGTGQAAAFNQNGTLNSTAVPASIGDVIVLYETGEGQTTPAGVDGKLAVAPYPTPNLGASVTIGGQPAQVQYAGGAPGEVAGLMQINVTIPAGIQTGSAVPVFVRVGANLSPAGVTISVH